MESVCRGNSTVGSNPTLSASFLLTAAIPAAVAEECHDPSPALRAGRNHDCPGVLAPELFRLRHRSDEFLHQVSHPFANRFVSGSEAVARSRHFVPTDQPPLGGWQGREVAPN